jgi:hypothetical protein
VSPSGDESVAAIVFGSDSSLLSASDGLLLRVAFIIKNVTAPVTRSSTNMMGIRYSIPPAYPRAFGP